MTKLKVIITVEIDEEELEDGFDEVIQTVMDNGLEAFSVATKGNIIDTKIEELE